MCASQQASPDGTFSNEIRVTTAPTQGKEEDLTNSIHFLQMYLQIQKIFF